VDNSPIGRAGPAPGATIAPMIPVASSSASVVEHIDLVIERSQRRRRRAWFLVVDDVRGCLANFVVDDVAEAPTRGDCRQVVDVFAHAVSHLGGGVALIVVLTRPGPPGIGPSEEPWFRAAYEICADYRVRLVGVYLAGPVETRQVFLDDVM
jgi:hypothetical protein